MVDFFVCKKQRTRGTLGYNRNRKTEEKSSKSAKPLKTSAKTENFTYSQNRKTQKQHWIIKPKNRYYFLRKPKTGC